MFSVTFISIPLRPMSVNYAWRGRKFKTPKYAEFEQDCFRFIKGVKTNGEVEVHFKFYLKKYKINDLDNFLKPLLDILVKCEMIDDDRFVMRIVAEKIKSTEDRIDIIIKPFTKI